jgi:hypothetical protein
VKPVETSTDSAAPPPPAATVARHRGLKLLIGVIVVLLIAELGTRAIASNLPAPLQWQSYETQRKVQQIDALSKKGGVKIAFIGSSLIDVGIEPTVIDREVGGGTTSYNAGLASSIPRMSVAWAESVVIPKLHPKVIVLGLSSYDLGSEDPNRTAFYNAFLASSGAKEAMGTEDPIQRVNRWLGSVSSLWFHKFQLRDPATVLRAIAGRPQPTDPEADDVSAHGRETIDQYTSFVNETGLDLKGWSIGTKDTDAVKQFITYAKKRHITVVLVDMPVTNQFVDDMPHGEADYQTFRAELAQLGAHGRATVLYYDTLRSDSLFQNDIHLNHAGAEFLSTGLGAALKHIIG